MKTKIWNWNKEEKMKILFHILSGQSLQNYIAAKIVNPDLNFYLYTKESKNGLNVHIEVLGKNYKSEQIESWDYLSVYKRVKNITEQYSEDTLLLNFTGGNKVISQAAFNAFKDKNYDCIYINSQDNEFIYFDHHKPGIEKVSSQKIVLNVNIADFLSLNGQKIKYSDNRESTEKEKLREFLTKNYKDYSKYILQFARNWDAKFPNSNNSKYISDGKFKGSYIKFEEECSQIYFVKNAKEELILKEEGTELLEYLTGKWFETACYLKLKSLNYFNEIQQNATLDKLNKSDSTKYQDKNEFDIIAATGVYPIIFECKAGGLRSEYIDKLNNFKQTYLGRYSSVFFITYFPINSFTESDILLNERLDENNIKLITFSELNSSLIPKLKSHKNLK